MNNLKSRIRDFSHSVILLKELYLAASKVQKKLLAALSDESFAKIRYKANTGKKLNLENPVTYDEKLWWLKLNNRDPLLTKCTDKYLVREYVKDCGLAHILNDLYGVYDDANEINYDELPDRFFVKCNNSSGKNLICTNKTTFSCAKNVKKLNKMLNSNYYIQTREWNYKNVRPKILCEKLLETSDKVGLIDYRFLCFNGVVKCVFVDIDTCAADGSHRPDARRNVYDANFNLLDVRVTRKRFDANLVSKPANFDEMIRYAEILSKPFLHCRVDLYNIEEKIIFGEITFYHAGGCNEIEPEEWALKMGDWIDLSVMKNDKK